MIVQTKLPKVGTTIFTVMSQLAARTPGGQPGAGLPGFRGAAAAGGRTGARDARRQEPVRADDRRPGAAPGDRRARPRAATGARSNADTEVTVTSGATEAHLRRDPRGGAPGRGSHRARPVLRLLRAGDRPGRRAGRARAAGSGGLSPSTGRRCATPSRPRTRMIMINSPHNPSGAMLDGARHGHAGRRSCAAPTSSLLSDEVYEHIVFDGRRHERVLRYPELAERAFVVSSFGKTYHCTGWKIGYCIAPPALTRRIPQGAPVQHLLHLRAGAVGVRRDDRRTSRSTTSSWARSTRPSATASASSCWRTRAEAAAGAGRLFPAGGLLGDQRPADDAEFCRWLTIEKGVAAIPLSPFYDAPPAGQRLVRLCFAKNEATLDAAIERLKRGSEMQRPARHAWCRATPAGSDPAGNRRLLRRR